MRKVVTDKQGTGSFADIFGYDVGGKTGTAKSYTNGNKNINTFISVFPTEKPKYVLLVILDDPKAAPHITYNYRGQMIKNIGIKSRELIENYLGKKIYLSLFVVVKNNWKNNPTILKDIGYID